MNPFGIFKGGFGSIMRATWTKTKDYVIFKKLFQVAHINNLDAFIHELQIHLRLNDNDRIIRCLGISKGNYYNRHNWFYLQYIIFKLFFV